MEASERMFFHKSERLYLKKDIDKLFADGQSFVSYPLRITCLSDTRDASPVSDISIFISVPKKRIRHAVHRNRMKRLIREAFRLNKKESSDLCKQKGTQLHIAFIYICNEIKTYADIEKSMLKALKIICKKELV
jgi:ribonuclease P protein component